MLPGCGKKHSNLSAGSPFEVEKCSFQFVNDVTFFKFIVPCSM